MREKLRCAVIGTGGIGLDHLQSLSACPRAATVAIAESDAQRGRDAANRFHVPRSYADYRELLEQPDIDAVTIALPNYLHAPVAIAALKARKHVLLEKPMATSARDAAKIIETATRMKRTVMVGQNFRFNRHTQSAKLCLERGTLGEVYHVRCFWLRRHHIPRIGSWFTQKQFAGGGCTYDLSVHMLDAGLHLLGEFEATSVAAQTHARFGPRGLGEMDWGQSEVDPRRPFDVEDCSIAFLRLKNSRTLLLECSWAGHHADGAREYGIDLLGADAGLSLFPARLSRNGTLGYERIDLIQPKLPYSEDRLHHFVSCVLDGKKPLVAPEESLQVQKILDAIYVSAASGKEVKVG